MSAELPTLRRRTVLFMATCVGLIVANIYYIQPLLAAVARDLHMSPVQAGLTATFTQVGTAFGMLFFVPLGDMLEKRALIVTLLFLESLALTGAGVAPCAWGLTLACFFVGGLGATTHIIVPFAAHLAPEWERGRVVGTVFGGLLLGILLARTFSGFVGAMWGWRSVFFIAAVSMALLALLVRKYLPMNRPAVPIRYGALMRSLLGLIRDHPALRESSLIGPIFFFVFSTFWTTLVFRLETPPFHYGERTAGLYGLVGAAGALAAPLVGRLADRRGPRATIGMALWVCAAGWGILACCGQSLWGLAIGAVVLDMGVQSGHVSNQTRIYALVPEARSRLNTVYMVSYFTGGALGSLAGSYGWNRAGWAGVYSVSFAALAVALVYYTLNAGRFRKRVGG